MRLRALAASASVVLLTGCHSAFIAATLRNATPQPLSLVELDYPSASFGTQTLNPGEDFHYRFKVLGSGDVKFLYTTPDHVDRHATGPHLQEGDEGSLAVILTPAGVQWNASLHNRSVR